jgi:uncharacterized protein YecE (DUF72 family)
MTLLIGTAGSAIPRAVADAFGREGSALQRYATRFAAVEVNSSFHRPHRRTTWERWAGSVPPGFRFSAKLPKTISHERKLVDCAEPLARFLDEVGGLGGKLAILLLQLPPKLAFDAAIADAFLRMATNATPVPIVCEPRHPSWFAEEADDLLRSHRIARVAADPAVTPAAAHPGGWRGITYHRWHGSPDMYRSSYADRLDDIARTLAEDAADATWCMFDNTASGAATSDALRLVDSMHDRN